MPPKKDGSAPDDIKNKGKKRSKPPRKKKDDCPKRIRKTDRVVLNKQARDIIAKVYDFMKREALTEYAEKLTNARWRTATAVGVSEKTVSRILKDRVKKLTDGSSAGKAISEVLGGKLTAANDAVTGVNALLSGNISGAGSQFGHAVGSVVRGDVAGVDTLLNGGNTDAAGHTIGSKDYTDTGLLGSAGKAVGEVLGGKLTAVKDVVKGAKSLLSGNISGAGSQFGHAVGSVVRGDVAGVDTLLNGGNTDAAGHTIGNKDCADNGLLDTVGEAVGKVIDGKLTAVNDVLTGAHSLLSGNINDAGSDFGHAVGSVVRGDVAGVGTLLNGGSNTIGTTNGNKGHSGTGLLDSTGKAVEEVLGGKLMAVKDLTTGVNSLLSGDISGAGSSVGHAVRSVVRGDVDGVGTLLNGGTFGTFDR